MHTTRRVIVVLLPSKIGQSQKVKGDCSDESRSTLKASRVSPDQSDDRASWAQQQRDAESPSLGFPGTKPSYEPIARNVAHTLPVPGDRLDGTKMRSTEKHAVATVTSTD
jgi:hypothetical protein